MQTIMAMMRELRWDRGQSADELAEQWGLAASTIRTMSSEAWRRVCAEVEPLAVQRDLGTLLVQDAHRASEAREWGDEARLADVASRILGARAPERHQHAVVVQQYEALPVPQRLAWLRERRARLDAEIARLEAEDDEATGELVGSEAGL